MIDDVVAQDAIPLGTFDRTQQHRMQRTADRFARAQLRTHAGAYARFLEEYPEFTNKKLFHDGLRAILHLKGAYHLAQRRNPNPFAAYTTQLAQEAVSDFFAAVNGRRFREVARIAAEMQLSVTGEPYDPYRNMLALALCSVRGPAVQMAKELEAIKYARKLPEREERRKAAEERVNERYPEWTRMKREAAYKRSYA